MPRLFVLAVSALLCGLVTLAACSDDPASEPPPAEPEPTAVTVTGSAQDTTGAAVAGAAVAAYPGGSSAPTDSALDETTTAADGSYELSFTVAAGEAPATLRLTFAAAGYEGKEVTVDFASSITYNADLVPEAGDPGDDGNDPDDNGDDDDGTTATLSGAITDADSGEAIEGATVTGAADGTELIETTTDAEGQYEATFTVEEAPEELSLSATADGYAEGTVTIAFAEEITANLALEPIDTSVEATITGTITGADSGGGIEGATVTGAAEGTELFETTTDAEGQYEVTFTVEEAPAELTIMATAEGFEDGAEAIAFAEEMTADLALEPIDTSVEATISGAVTDADTGEGIEGATITGTADGSELFETTTDSDGQYDAAFTVEEAPEELSLSATADGYADGTKTIAFAEKMTASFSLEPVDASVEATISGQVTTDADSGDAIEGATVTGTAEGSDLFETTTDSDGQYEATFTVEEAPEELTVTATAEDYDEATTTIAFAEEITANLALESTALARYVVEVILTNDLTAEPVAFHTLTLSGTDLNGEPFEIVSAANADGQSTATYPEAAEVTIELRKEGYAPRTEIRPGDAGHSLAQELERVPDTYAFDLTITDLFNDDGSPHPSHQWKIYTTIQDNNVNVETQSHEASSNGTINITVEDPRDPPIGGFNIEDIKLKVGHNYGGIDKNGQTLEEGDVPMNGPWMNLWDESKEYYPEQRIGATNTHIYKLPDNTEWTTDLEGGMGIDQVTANLNNLLEAGDLRFLTIRTGVETYDGQYISTNNEVLIDMLRAGGSVSEVVNYWPTPDKPALNFTAIENNDDTGEYIGDEQLQAKIKMMEDTQELFTTGPITLFHQSPPVTTHPTRIAAFDDIGVSNNIVTMYRREGPDNNGVIIEEGRIVRSESKLAGGGGTDGGSLANEHNESMNFGADAGGVASHGMFMKPTGSTPNTTWRWNNLGKMMTRAYQSCFSTKENTTTMPHYDLDG